MSDATDISETVLDEEKSADTHPPHHLYRIATLQERIVSFLVDLIFNLYLVGGWGLLLSRILHQRPFHFEGSSQLLFLSTAFALHFLYFLFFEGVLTATPGKLLGGLIIHKQGGGVPSLWAVLVRNILRIIDYPLFLLTGSGLMDMTKRCRRLGDIVAGTVVLKRMPFREINREIRSARPATLTFRIFAFLIDLPFILALLYGLLLLIPVDRRLIAMVLLNLSPLILLLILSLGEWIFQTSPGKVLFGYRVVQEEGTPVSPASLLTRNLLLPLDLNPMSYLVALASRRKQRPGDLIAGTRVVVMRRSWRQWLAWPVFLALSGTLLFFGWRHPMSFFQAGYQIRLGTWQVEPIPVSLQRYWYRSLQLEKLELAFSATEVNESRRFDRGDVIFVLLRVSGFHVQEARAWIQLDLKVKDPARNIVLDRRNALNASVKEPGQYLDLATRFALHPQALSGRYQLELAIRDRLARSTRHETTSFVVP